MSVINGVQGQYVSSPEESRYTRVWSNDSTSVAPGATIDLINIANAGGNVESIQISSSAASAGAYLGDDTISIYVDGQTVLNACPLGLLMGFYGAAVPFSSKHFSLISVAGSPNNATSISGKRDLVIPYLTSIRISVTVTNGSPINHLFSTHVVYRQGFQNILGTDGSRRRKFHAVYNSFNSYPAFATIPVVNSTAFGNPGLVDSVQMFIFDNSGAQHQPTWLEGNPLSTADQEPQQQWASTDAFFGSQNYFSGLNPLATDLCGGHFQQWQPSAGVWNQATMLYRFFDNAGFVFNQGQFSLSFANGQNGQGVAPPAVLATSLLIYYTSF